MTNTNTELARISADILAAQQRSKQALPANILSLYLAHFFAYQVTQGGFAQLLYNLKGRYLPDIEQMLIDAQATVAHEYYTRAIRECLAHKTRYQEFIQGSYTQANTLKDALQGISIDYFKQQVDFLSEAQDYIAQSIPLAKNWLQHTQQSS